MKAEAWKVFWEKVINKKKVFELNRSTFFHYVVLEFLGHSPNYTLTKDEQRRIRELEKNTDEYENLFKLYEDRMKEYTIK